MKKRVKIIVILITAIVLVICGIDSHKAIAIDADFSTSEANDVEINQDWEPITSTAIASESSTTGSVTTTTEAIENGTITTTVTTPPEPTSRQSQPIYIRWTGLDNSFYGNTPSSARVTVRVTSSVLARVTTTKTTTTTEVVGEDENGEPITETNTETKTTYSYKTYSMDCGTVTFSGTGNQTKYATVYKQGTYTEGGYYYTSGTYSISVTSKDSETNTYFSASTSKPYVYVKLRTTSVKVTKQWLDDGNRDGFRPSSLGIKIHEYLGDGTSREIRTTTISGTTAANTVEWTPDVTIPAYVDKRQVITKDAEGNENCWVEETTVPDKYSEID